MTVQDLIDGAYVDIGAVAAGESPNTSERNQGLTLVNQVLDQWSSEGLTCYDRRHSTFSLSSGSDYTLGPSGSWVTVGNPVKVEAAMSKSGNFSQGMKIVPFSAFTELAEDVVGSQAVLPELMAVDNGFPNINCRVWRTPVGGASIQVDYWVAFTQFASLSDVVTLRAGYATALRLALAQRLLTIYPREGYSPQVVLGNAQAAKAALADLNAQIFGTNQAPPQQQQQ